MMNDPKTPQDDEIDRIVEDAMRQVDERFEQGLRRSMSVMLSLPEGRGDEIDQHDDVIAWCRAEYAVQRREGADRLREQLRRRRA